MKKLISTLCLVGVSALTFMGIVDASANNQQHVAQEENVLFNTVKGNNETRSVNFDDNWRFNLGDLSNAEDKTFDDSTWQQVNLPHDYSITQDYTNSVDGESGYKPGGVGWYRKSFNVDSSFTENHSIRLDFDGVYMDSTVYLNGEKLGNHPYGYTPFSFDITSKIKRNDENVIAVKVNHETPSSRWYSGSGIYRSVHLTITNDAHVDLFGSKFDVVDLKGETPNITIKGKTTVKNNYAEAKSLAVKYELHEKTDKGLAKIAESNKSNVAQIEKLNTKDYSIDNFSVPRKDIKLWSVDTPNMYVLRTLVLENDKVLDTYDVDYGFRYTDWTPNDGFSLNGKKMKLQGVCMHHDQGALGAVANKDAQERQILTLKEMGVNAIRVTHNPASQTLIDLANKHGMLLIEEMFDGWHKAKNNNSNDYSKFFNEVVGQDNNILGSKSNMPWHEFDLSMAINRGYNAPSIFMWSLGNEIQEGTGWTMDGSFVTNHRKLAEIARKIDPYRYITTGDNLLKSAFPGNSTTIGDQNTEFGGSVGLNYASGSKYDSYHSSYPKWLMYASETSSAVNSRGVYYKTGTSESNMELTSYDEKTVPWGYLSSESWFEITKRDFMAGEFVWTGFDYLGEPTPWNQQSASSSTTFPQPKSSYFGIVDTAGMPKDRYYFYQSQWAPEKNTLHILPTWDKDNISIDSGNKVRVDVYSSAAKVKLELFNRKGESVWVGEDSMKKFKSNTGLYEYQARNDGKKHTDLFYQFQVPYTEGRLVATAYDKDGKVISKTSGRNEVVTSTGAAKLKATVNKNKITGNDYSLAYIQVDVVDAKGNIVSKANNLITTTVTGNGRYLAMDNGKQADMRHYHENKREAYNGSVVAIVGGNNTSGKMTVTFEAQGLEKTSVEITVDKPISTNGGSSGLQMSKNYYILTGSKPTLPAEVKLISPDGKIEPKKVVWNDTNKYDKAGIYRVDGVVDGKYKTSVNIYVTDGLGGIYNQSQRIEKGKKPTIPSRLTAYDINGEKLPFNIDVKWEYPTDDVFDRFGTILINGTADFLGTKVKVTTTLSIREGTITIGEASISRDALNVVDKFGESKLHSKDEILKTLYDGNKEIKNSLLENTWTNYDALNQGHSSSEIIFSYATQTTLGKISIYYVNKTTYMEAPKPYTTKIYVSESGLDDSWQEVDYDLTIGNTINDVCEYTFNIEPTTATFIKFVNNSDTSQFKNYIGITEIELYTAIIKNEANNTALLEELTINGVVYDEYQLRKKNITITDTTTNISYKVKDNASVTILPLKNNIQKIHVISEDKSVENIYNINVSPTLKEEFEGKLKVISAPEAENEKLGPNNLVDGIVDNDNHYHSKWSTNLGLSEKNSQSIIIDSGEQNKLIQGFTYLPRPDGGVGSGTQNGRVNGFKLYISTENGNWGEPVYKGNFKDEQGLKTVKFEPKSGRYIRFEVTSSYGDWGQSNKYISGVELNILLKRHTEITNDIKVSLFKTGATFDAKTISKVMIGNDVLRPNFDYTIKYGEVKDNQIPVTITGVGLLTGSVTKNININDTEIVKVQLLNNPHMFYTVGDIVDSSSLIAKVTNKSGEEITINNTGDELFKYDTKLFDNYLKSGEQETIVNVLGSEFKLLLNVTKYNITNNTDDFIRNFTYKDNKLSKFTTTSISQYKKSLQTLNDLNTKNASSEEIYKAKKDVLNSINSLTLIGDTTNLESLINEKVDYKLYTQDSYNNYLSVVYSIKEKLMNKNSLSTADIENLTKDFNTAKENLVLITPVDPDKPVNPDKPVDPDKPVEPDNPVNPDNEGTTNINSNKGYIIGLSVGIPLALILGGLLTFLFTKNKKDKNK